MAQNEVVLDGELSLNLQIDGTADKVIKIFDYMAPVYTGDTEITPSTERQILLTANSTVTSNIVVEPIPSNYGLITWNGSALTIS